MERLLVPAEPHPWPLLGPVDPAQAALVVIDLQADFVRPNGWFHRMGFDISALEALAPVVAGVLTAARAVPGLRVVHTRQGNAPDLHDVPPVKLEQGRRVGVPIGSEGPLGRGLVRGEPGWTIVEEVAPVAGERIVDKPGYSAFHGTDLHEWLQAAGVRALVFTGVTANVCVLSSLYAAVDLGYDCLVVSDAIAGADALGVDTVLDMVRYQGGLFGSITTAERLNAVLRRASG